MSPESFGRSVAPRKKKLTLEQAELDVAKLSVEEQTKLLAMAGRRLGVSAFYSRLEDLIDTCMLPAGFELSPLQRAICRLVQGLPLGALLRHPHVHDALGLDVDGMLKYEAARLAEQSTPREVMIIAGIRTFKSMLLAAIAIWAAQNVTCQASMGAGEIPRYSIVSVKKDNAKIVMGHLLGALRHKSLQGLLIGDDEMKSWAEWKDIIKESGEDVVGSAFLRHPSGRPIEVRVVAGSRAGGSVVSRWCAGLGLDEAPRMVGADEGVVNYEDMRGAVLGRLLDGAQVFSVGSPWQPRGPVYDVVQEWFGRPNKDRVVVRAKAYHMNPSWWTPQRCEELRRSDPVQYQMDVEAEFADVGEALIPQILIAQATRAVPLVVEYNKHHEYAAAMDPATRSNAWTLVIADRCNVKGVDGVLRDVKRIVFNQQWIGDPLAPLRPRDVLKEIAEILGDYELDMAYTDQWAAEALQDIAQTFGLTLVLEEWNAKENMDAYLSFRTAMEEGCVELPPDSQVAKDIRLIRKVAQPRGPTIRLGTTADGRHCDYAPALVRALKPWLDEAKAPEHPVGSPEAVEEQLDEWREAAYDKVRESTQPVSWLTIDPFADPDEVDRAGIPLKKSQSRRNKPWLTAQ